MNEHAPDADTLLWDPLDWGAIGNTIGERKGLGLYLLLTECDPIVLPPRTVLFRTPDEVTRALLEPEKDFIAGVIAAHAGGPVDLIIERALSEEELWAAAREEQEAELKRRIDAEAAALAAERHAREDAEAARVADAKRRIDAVNRRCGIVTRRPGAVTRIESGEMLDSIAFYLEQAATPVELLERTLWVDRFVGQGVVDALRDESLFDGEYMALVERAAYAHVKARCAADPTRQGKERILSEVMFALEEHNPRDRGVFEYPRFNGLERRLKRLRDQIQSMPEDPPAPAPAAAPRERLRWIGNQSQLAYLVGRLVEKGLLEGSKHWQATAAAFEQKDGGAFDPESLRKTASRYFSENRRTGSPKGAGAIDEAAEGALRLAEGDGAAEM